MVRNVFVLGLNDLQRRELETLNAGHREQLAFRDLIGVDALVTPGERSFADLLDRGRSELDAFDGSVDAIITHWDFPTSVLGPMLACERGLPAPSLESLLKCEHKYWSRIEQAKAAPECVPRFDAFDPFADGAADRIDLDYPFWVKPVKAHSSQLGFEITDRSDLDAAVQEIRAGIHEIADAFDDVLDMADLPTGMPDAPATTCLAEQLIDGVQAAPEGSMSQGRFDVHGIVDVHFDEDGESLIALDYPASSIPGHVQDRMVDVAERVLRQVGYDDGCFNIEYLWDPEPDQLWIVEVNSRISQSHSDLFTKVDGRSNHEIALDVALARAPRLPEGCGAFPVAAKCVVTHPDDGIVTAVPDDSDVAALQERFPGTIVQLNVRVGDHLAELPHQDPYTYVLANVYLGAHDRDELEHRRRACVEQLHAAFAFDRS